MPKVLIFLILTNLLPFLAAKILRHCIDKENRSITNSTYKTNLDALLLTLPTSIDASGFHNASAGQIPDQVNAIALCRGDVKLDMCQQCLRAAIIQLPSSCPNRKQAIIWYDECMLRYSNDTIYGTLATSPAYWAPSDHNATSPNRFVEDLRVLLGGIRSKAVGDTSHRNFAAGNMSGPDSQSIFALVQCTPDLNPEECDCCLMVASEDIPRCCDKRSGATILKPSCILRYETYLFFNEAGVDDLVQVQVPTGKDSGGNRTRIIIMAVASISAFLVVVAVLGVVLRMRRKRKALQLLKSMDNINRLESLQYAFSTIRAATSDFSDSNKIGEGGFGAVYKGILPDGQEIAVKRLSKDSGQGSLEFKNEVQSLAKLQHRNLIRLLGFSIEGAEKLLLYAFVPNGSLDHFIFDPTKRRHFDWDTRYKIIKGVARGLLYLHVDSRLKIIHRDLKPNNILVDEEMNPKIADFGMAKISGQDETQGNTQRIVGTYGYMPPEYAMHGNYSVKSDVYSFGVLVLEIISGEKNGIRTQSGEHAVDLVTLAWTNWRDGSSENTMDPLLRYGSESANAILRCIHIGLLCVQKFAADRPTMDSVVKMLSTLSITLASPSEPAFYFPSSRSNTPAQSNERLSENEVSMSEFCPR